VFPMPQTVAAPAGPARVAPGGGTDLKPSPRWRTWAFLWIHGRRCRRKCHHHPCPRPPTNRWLPLCRRHPGIGTRAPNSWWPTAPRTPCPSGVYPERWSAGGTCHPWVVPPGPPVGAPTTRSAAKPRPCSLGPPRDPQEAPMETDPEPVARDRQGGTRTAPPPATGPMDMDEPSSEGQVRPSSSQPNTPRSRPRTPAPTHRSGMWFCPMSRCARREGASPTGWSCLHSLVSHLRSVHLSTAAAPPDAWLDAHGLRVCLACREINPQGSRWPSGPS